MPASAVAFPVGRTRASTPFMSSASVIRRPRKPISPRSRPLITVGDNAYTNGTQSDWDNNVFISQFKNGILRRAVFVPTLGNHDLNNVGASNWASSVEIKMHALPRNADAGQEERYFSFDDGNAHFVALDTEDGGIYDRANQVAWLRSDLQAHRDATWTFVFYHHPGYTCTYKGYDDDIIRAFHPVFDEFRVDMVFMGHAHTYERLDQPRGQFFHTNWTGHGGTVASGTYTA